jgi:hypothetical protein
MIYLSHALAFICIWRSTNWNTSFPLYGTSPWNPETAHPKAVPWSSQKKVLWLILIYFALQLLGDPMAWSETPPALVHITVYIADTYVHSTVHQYSKQNKVVPPWGSPSILSSDCCTVRKSKTHSREIGDILRYEIGVAGESKREQGGEKGGGEEGGWTHQWKRKKKVRVDEGGNGGGREL